MFDFLRNLFKKEAQLLNVQNISFHLGAIVASFESEYMKDVSAKNAAIDAVISLLTEYKDVAPVVAVITTQTPITPPTAQ